MPMIDIYAVAGTFADRKGLSTDAAALSSLWNKSRTSQCSDSIGQPLCMRWRPARSLQKHPRARFCIRTEEM